MKSVIADIGPIALTFFEEDRVLIFFGPDAPPELREVSIIHNIEELGIHRVQPGSVLRIGRQEYEMVDVGAEVKRNIEQLGHFSVYFTDPPAQILPGSVYVRPFIFPEVQIGVKIEIESRDFD